MTTGQTTVSLPQGAVPEGGLTVSAQTVDPNSAPAPTGAFQVNGEVFELTATDQNGDPVTSFAEPVTITVGYDPTGMTTEQELGQVIAWWDPSTSGGAGEWISLPTEVDVVAHELRATTSHFTRFGVLTPKPGAIKILYLPLLGGSGKK